MQTIVWSQKETTVFLLQAGDKRLIVNIGPHQGDSEVADAFKRGQFDLLPNGFQEGLLTILGKAPASSGNLECSLVTLVDLASAELKAARQIRTEDGEIVWGCTSRNALVSAMSFCTSSLILRTEPYHGEKRDNDPGDEGPVTFASESGDTEVVIHCNKLDLDVEMHTNLLFGRLQLLPEECRIAFVKVLGTSGSNNFEAAKQKFSVDKDGHKPLVKFDSNHLTEWASGSPVRFELFHRDLLKSADYGDDVEFLQMCSTPFLTGDHKGNKRDKRGYLDLTAEFQLADLFWLSEHLNLRGPPYIWKNQYLQEVDSVSGIVKCRPRFKALLQAFYQRGWDEAWESATLAQLGEVRSRTSEDIQYILTGEKSLHSITGLVPRMPLVPVSPATSSLKGTFEGGRSKDLIIKPGMGVALHGPAGKPAFGHVVGVLPGLDADVDVADIVLRPVLGKNSIPIGILTLADHEVLQTNIVLRVKATSIMGTYSHLPAAMFHAGCEAPQILGKRPRPACVSVTRDKTLVAHAEVLDLDCSQYQDIEILERILDGSKKFQLWRVSPVAAETCLSVLVEGSRLFGGAGRQLACYCAELEALMHQFARSKTNANLKVKENTFKVPFAGRILMEIVATNVRNCEYVVTLDSGKMTITVTNIAALELVFGRSIETYDFHNLNRGFVKIYGPVAFKWAMYDDVQPDGRVGRTEGLAAVTVGGWKELNRMGQMIKSSFENKSSRAELSRPPK